jgi:hypothetical protein
VWHVPSTERTLIEERTLIALIQKGTATLADLTSARAIAAGVVQLGLAVGELAAAGCPFSGNGCVDVHAVSILGVTPSAWHPE